MPGSDSPCPRAPRTEPQPSPSSASLAVAACRWREARHCVDRPRVFSSHLTSPLCRDRRPSFGGYTCTFFFLLRISGSATISCAMGVFSLSHRFFRRSVSSRDRRRSRSRENPGREAPDGDAETPSSRPPPPPAASASAPRRLVPDVPLANIFTPNQAARASASSNTHLRLRSECGLCGEVLGPGERCITREFMRCRRSRRKHKTPAEFDS